MDLTATHRAIDTVWRAEAARVIAAVARRVRDVGVAEELAQDALVAALERWPRDGVPDNPGAWLMTTAINRALDRLRQQALHARKNEQYGQEQEVLYGASAPDPADMVAAAQDDDVGDDLLRLIFTACHPVLPTDGRVALTLRLLGGLSTDDIARAFLVPEATIAQRIVRAKRSLTAAAVPFDVPDAQARPERLGSVLEVIYLIFNEGYSATAGDDLMRPALCTEAIRLGRVLAGLTPDDSEVFGLLALMQLQASRAAARVDAAGRPVLLADQDRTRWDATLIRQGLDALDRAEHLSGEQTFATRPAPGGAEGLASGAVSGAALGEPAEPGGPLGPYALQAALAACHARAETAHDTDWRRIVAIYNVLMARSPSPVVALNRAVAVGMAEGPKAGLALVDVLAQDNALARYPWLFGVRGDLLARLGRHDEARDAFTHAAGLTRNAKERDALLARASGLP